MFLVNVKEGKNPFKKFRYFYIQAMLCKKGLHALAKHTDPILLSTQADPNRNLFDIGQFSVSERPDLPHDSVGCWTKDKMEFLTYMA